MATYHLFMLDSHQIYKKRHTMGLDSIINPPLGRKSTDTNCTAPLTEIYLSKHIWSYHYEKITRRFD